MTNETQSRLPLPDDVRAALERVIDYAWPVERDDYDLTPADERPGHVFESLRLLRRWLEGEMKQDGADLTVSVLGRGGLAL